MALISSSRNPTPKKKSDETCAKGRVGIEGRNHMPRECNRARKTRRSEYPVKRKHARRAGESPAHNETQGPRRKIRSHMHNRQGRFPPTPSISQWAPRLARKQRALRDDARAGWPALRPHRAGDLVGRPELLLDSGCFPSVRLSRSMSLSWASERLDRQRDHRQKQDPVDESAPRRFRPTC